MRPSRALADAGQHQAPQRQRAVRLVDVDGAVDRRQRRPGLHQLGRHAQGAGRGVRVGEGVRVLRRCRPSARSRARWSSGHAQLRQQQRHQLAGGGGGRVDPDRRPEARVQTWWSTFATRALASQSAWSIDHRCRCAPGRRRRPPRPRPARAPGAFRTWSMRGRKASNGGGGSALTTSAALPIRSAAMAMAMAAPSVSASGFSWQIAVTRCARAQQRDDLLHEPSLVAVSASMLAQDAQHAVAGLDRVVGPDARARGRGAGESRSPSWRRSHGVAERERLDGCGSAPHRSRTR